MKATLTPGARKPRARRTPDAVPPRVDPTFAKLQLVCAALTDAKANALRVLDVRAVTTLADYFVIATGTSSVHINSITEGVREKLREHGYRARPEGKSESSWTLLDYGDVIAHVFSEDLRTLYDLEHLWGDAVASDWTETDGVPSATPRRAVPR